MSLNIVQNLDIEIDSTKLLKQYLELVLPTVLNSTEEIAIKIVDHTDELKEAHYPTIIHVKENILPILFIEGWYASKDNKERSFFNGYKPWITFKGETAVSGAIDCILQNINDNRKELDKRFFKECGNGYNYGFNKYDGSIHSGFNLMSNKTFPDSLSLSLVHIYYGK